MGKAQGTPKEESKNNGIGDSRKLFKHEHSLLKLFCRQIPSSTSTYSISDDVSPLNYQLTADDFIALAQSDGQLLYGLDPSITILLFWVLQRLARYITCAASHELYHDPTVPFTNKGYIPQFYFNRISMQ